MLPHVTSCWIMLLHATSCYLRILHVTLCYFMSLHATSCDFMLLHATSCYLMLINVTLVTCAYTVGFGMGSSLKNACFMVYAFSSWVPTRNISSLKFNFFRHIFQAKDIPIQTFSFVLMSEEIRYVTNYR